MTSKRVKEIKEELKVETETYQRFVLDRADELYLLGQFESAKEFSKKIVNLSDFVPPIELEASI